MRMSGRTSVNAHFKKPANMLSFPPLVKKWTVKSEANWPGAENTRKTKLKTRLDQNYSSDFIEELKATLGDNFDTFEQVRSRRLSPVDPVQHPTGLCKAAHS